MRSSFLSSQGARGNDAARTEGGIRWRCAEGTRLYMVMVSPAGKERDEAFKVYAKHWKGCDECQRKFREDE